MTQQYFPVTDLLEAIDHALTVAPPTTEPLPPVMPHADYFDGEAIDETRVKLTACANLQEQRSYSLEQTVTLTLRAQVTGIDHRVDKRTGNLIRLHTLTVSEIVTDAADHT